MALLLCTASAVQAQQGIPLTMAEAEDIALEAEPGREAMLARARALEEQSVAAGQLPDPQLTAGLLNYPIESGGFSTEAMTQAQLGIRQAFPAGKTRTFSTERLRSLAAEQQQNSEARARDVVNSTRHAWLEVYYWQRAHEIVLESRPFFEDLAEITRSLYSLGRKLQQDVLRAELELKRLDDRLIEIDRREGEARAQLAEWLGTEASRPVAPSLPVMQQVPPVATLQNALASHPALLAADARVTAQGAGVDLANERYKPEWALDLRYGYREGMLPSGEPRSDFVSLSVTVGLPFFHKNRQDRSLTAALQERSAAKEQKTMLARQLRTQLDVQYRRWQELTRRLALYESDILSLSADQAQASLLAYQSESGDFADVMQSYIDDLNTRLDHVRLQVERGQTYAAIANLGGLGR